MDFDEIEYENIDYDRIEDISKDLDTIFAYNNDIYKTAYLNWNTGNMFTNRSKFVFISETYFTSAYNLLKQCLNDNHDRKADYWIFPIMFNIVHGIEVYLKAIIVALKNILERRYVDIEFGHNILKLCNETKELLIKFKNISNNKTSQEMIVGIELVCKFIENIYAKTNDMTFSRYPLSKNRDKQFYVKYGENEVIDLEKLKEQMVYVYKMLSFIDNILCLYIEYNCEADYE